MEQSALTGIFIPASLVMIMLGMGLSLETSDFRRLFETPRAVGAGLVAQLLLVPAAGFLVVALLQPRPVLAVGLMIISFCPGGAVSNLICHLARGNTALSVTLTAISSLVTVTTIPILVNLAMRWQLGDATVIELPVLETAAKLSMITILPVGIGMAVRRHRRAFAQRSETTIKFLSALFLFLVIVVAVGQNVEELPRYVREIGIALVAFNGLVLLLGYGTARILSLESRDRVTISIEAGVQNGALGIAIPTTFIGIAEMAIPPAIYGVLMILSAAVFVVGARHRD